MADNLSVVAIIIAVLAIGLVLGGSATGMAVTSSGQAKTANTPCARGCTIQCTPNAALPNPDAEELAIHDCILQCMNALCGQTARAGKCDAFAEDGCCNIFASADPDCAPACVPLGQCLDPSTETCCEGSPGWNGYCMACLA